ncbi:MAG: GNAT family N-acetyltransferase [Phycisphaerae bacterium]
MAIRLAENEDDLRRCYPVMAQLRDHLDERAFVAQAARQRQQGAYHVAFVEQDGRITAVAGFRIMEMLLHGRHLYVDDLVTDGSARSSGHGGALFDWLMEHARSNGCRELQLDSGVQRDRAHRFYFRKGMHIAAYHFRVASEPKPDPRP